MPHRRIHCEAHRSALYSITGSGRMPHLVDFEEGKMACPPRPAPHPGEQPTPASLGLTVLRASTVSISSQLCFCVSTRQGFVSICHALARLAVGNPSASRPHGSVFGLSFGWMLICRPVPLGQRSSFPEH